MIMKIWELLDNENGEVGIKQIAITVAIIVVIGIVIGIVRGNMAGWVGEIWTLFLEQIRSLIS